MRRLPAAVRRHLDLAVDPTDRHRLLTVLAAAGLAGAAVLAVFGLPPADLHGLLHFAGIMDPLCGATRGVRHTARGEWALAWRYNPASIPLVAGAVLLLIRHLVGALTGRWVTVRVRRTRTTVTLAVIALLVLQVNQQLHADLLMAR